MATHLFRIEQGLAFNQSPSSRRLPQRGFYTNLGLKCK